MAPGAATTPIFRRKTRESACITFWNRAGRRTPPFRGLAARTAPIGRSRPCSGPSRHQCEGEKRFLSTIARRLDSLGAITRGQRQTGGQGLFRPEGNLESPYARTALLELYTRAYQGKVEFASLGDFEAATGLRLQARNGSMPDEVPPIATFLNCVLALPIGLQNRFFELFEELLAIRVEAAIVSGIYDSGLETLIAPRLSNCAAVLRCAFPPS